jgi:replicative DNA helicase
VSRRHGADPRDESAAERSLPHSLDAERSVLGAVLVNNAAYIEASRVVQPEDFFRDAHRRIFKAMTTLLERPGGACDFVLLREELTRVGDIEEVGGASYLVSLVDGVPRSTNVRHYAGIVKDKARGRSLIYALNNGIAGAYEQEQDVDTVLEDVDRSVLYLRHGADLGDVKSLARRTSGLMADLEFRVANKGKLTGIDTGFKRLNDMTNGWQRGDLIIMAARPSMGKTALLCNTLMAGAEFALPAGETGRRVALVFSMEMKARQLEYRFLSSLSGIASSKLTGGYMGPSGSSDWTQLNAAIERMHAARVHIDDTPALTVSQIRAECRRLQSEEGRLDLVALDYVQLMQGSITRRNATRTEELADVSRRLKVLAGELGVPFLVASQLKRTGGGRPKLEDLRESGNLEQDADVVVMLHRKNHKDGGRTEAIFEKNRNGPTGTELLTFHKDIIRFEDCYDEPTPEEQAADDAEERQAAKGKAIAKRRRKVTI